MRGQLPMTRSVGLNLDDRPLSKRSLFFRSSTATGTLEWKRRPPEVRALRVARESGVAGLPRAPRRSYAAAVPPLL